MAPRNSGAPQIRQLIHLSVEVGTGIARGFSRRLGPGVVTDGRAFVALPPPQDAGPHRSLSCFDQDLCLVDIERGFGCLDVDEGGTARLV